MKMAIEKMQKFPILAKIICKCPISWLAPPTNVAARPKNVLVPVPITVKSQQLFDQSRKYVTYQ
jgi:hypothetical protein